MFTLIKPGTKIDFMGRRKLFFAISGAIVTASLVAVAILGLNQGIDFKGGTKVIVSFKADSQVDREALRGVIEGMVTKETGEKGTQVEVQDFDIAAAEDVEGRGETHKYQIYTELTTLLTDAKREAVVKALQARFGEDTRVETPEEGGDVFYITFAEQVPAAERMKEISEVFATDELGYENVQVVSDRERAIEVDYIREVNLILDESETVDDSEVPDDLTRSSFEERKAAMLAKMKDARYTVTIEELKAKLTESLKSNPTFGADFLAVESSTSVSASVGSDLLADGLLAVLYAIIGMLIYITLRFDLRYAPGAVVALVHDVSITIGIFALLQVKFTLPIIAALLTIVGYSLNDTIVVFDRIRENIEKLRGRAFEQVINISINETLSRTLLTSITTLLVVIAILVLGGGLIQDFAFALTIGIVVGTYSSVFIASPVALYMDNFLAERAGARKAGR